MSYSVIIRGPMAVGKTTVAKQLAILLRGEYVSVDQVLAEHKLDQVPPGSESIPVDRFLAANDLIIPKALESLEHNMPVIFDAAFYHREVIDDLVQSLPYQHFIFTLKAPVEICIERDKKRKQPYGQEAVQAVHSLVSRFDAGIIIDASQQEIEVVEDILEQLPLTKSQTR